MSLSAVTEKLQSLAQRLTRWDYPEQEGSARVTEGSPRSTVTARRVRNVVDADDASVLRSALLGLAVYGRWSSTRRDRKGHLLGSTGS